MAQHDYVLDNATGANFRSDLNNALLAISSNNSGSSAPSTTYALQFYADTTNNILKLRNAANDGFINLFTLAGGVDVDAASNFNEDVTFTGASANIVFDKSADDLIFNDNAKAVFGTSSDGLEIFHDASDSIINDNGTGSLKLQLGGSTKAEIVSGGLTVTGTVTATTFSGALSGNATTATTATTATNANHVSVADNESTNENNLIPFIEDASATGNVGLESDGDFTYNPSTGTVTATKFAGDGSALTGITGTATTINNNGVSRVITGSETANTLEGQANFTFNGNEVKVTQTTSTSDCKFILRNSNTPATGSMRFEFHHGTGSTEGTDRFRYGFIEGLRQDSSNAGALAFGTKADNASSPAEKMRLTKNGRLGIGTTSPSHLFTVVDSSTSIGFSRSGNNPQIVLDANNLSNSGIIQVDESSGGSLFTFSTKTTSGTLQQNFRINMAGDVTTTSDVTYTRSTAGFTARKSDSVSTTRPNGFPLEINRTSSDGGLINFFQDGSQEGNISVSGSSVSYNGGHLSRWSQIKGLSQTDKSARPTIYQGTVMSNLDDLCVWHHADELYDKGDELNQSIPEGKKIGDVKTPAYDEINQQLNMTKISDTVGDKNAAGVFWAWDDDDDEIVNDFYIAMTGDMVIRVAESTTVARGDLLISAGDGTAKPQDDDIVRSSTIAKIISTNHTATYADGSKAYPCVLMAC